MKHGWLVAVAALVACGKSSTPTPVPAPHDHVALAKPGEPDDTCDPKIPKLCMGNDVVACEADGHLGRRLRACHKGCSNGSCDESCQDDNTKLIYIVSTSNDFLSFDPRKLPGNPVKRVGKLTCESYGSPFAMSIDRSGTAWVEYDDSEVFRVNITTAECEKSPAFTGPNGVFTMAFTTDPAGERLYTAIATQAPELSVMDTKDLVRHGVGQITQPSDEPVDLTGTGDGKLFGFFSSFTEPSYVQELSRSGAVVGKRMPIGTTSLGGFSAWAFAQWGGSFYVFTTTGDRSSVHSVDRATGVSRTVISNLGYQISGAGVSTCAPERDTGNVHP